MPSEKLWKSEGGMHVNAATPAEPAVTSAHVIAPRGASPSRRADHHRHATTSASEPASTAPARLVHASSASAIVTAVQRGRARPRLTSATTSSSTPSPYERVITEYSNAKKYPATSAMRAGTGNGERKRISPSTTTTSTHARTCMRADHR